jgi:ankyrin repeat protein
MRLFFWLERIGLNRLLHDFDGLLPMHHALKAGCWTLFESLCQSKRELYYLTPSGQSLMVYGMLSGNKQIVESLLRLAKHLAPEDEIKEFFSRPDSLGFPPLAYAFYNSCPDGRREFVRDMLALQFSFGPEQCAAIVSLFVEDNSPGRFETLDLIYRNCGMIDLPICHGTTLLQWASQNGDIPLAAYALSRGAAINPSPTPDLPATPLIGATIHNQAAMVQFLLSQGADPFLQNLTGDSPVELILERCVKNEPIDIGIFNLLYEAMKLQFESIIASSVAVQTIAAPLTIDPKMVFPAEPS